mgnify:CR=1 FL=1
MSCVFCQIIEGKLPARVVHRDALVTVFHDRAPITPVHLLVVPNRHLESLNQAQEEDKELLGHMILTAQNIASRMGIEQSGYRLVINTGRDAGQSVFHLHLHLLGGARMAFPLQPGEFS